MKNGKKADGMIRFVGFFLACFSLCSVAQADTFVLPTNGVQNYFVPIVAHIQESPPEIELEWGEGSIESVSSYTIFRKSKSSQSWGTALATLSGSVHTWTDMNVAVGSTYEYQIKKSAPASSGYGYIYAGIEVPFTESRGTLVLIVDDSMSDDLSDELSTLESDLIGDGWMVNRHDVGRDDDVTEVKELIIDDYEEDPANVKAVLLVGHVPVPYSGEIVPDGHSPTHRGAWPADVYYGEMDGVWTDSTITSTVASEVRNQNTPGDGKFDQSRLPSYMELQVGRIDLSNMSAFSGFGSETELLRRYLARDHEYRHGDFTADRNGLISDNFGVSSGSAFAQSGWKNMTPLLGGANLTETASGFIAAIKNASYLWTYGAGGGSYTSASGIGQTSDYASAPTYGVFNMLFGSYFGDWDSPNNFLRAPLAGAGYGLTSVWAGRPNWFFHHMALGETVGYGALISQNNNISASGPYRNINAGSGQIHVALMGDPTLRQDVVLPPTDLEISDSDSTVSLEWESSPDPDVLGYHVYRAESSEGPFVRVSDDIIEDTTFEEYLPTGMYAYMVRAVKLEETPSGSYYNLSQGLVSETGGIVSTNEAPLVDVGANVEVTLPEDTVALDPDVSDDGLPDTDYTVLWSSEPSVGMYFTATTSSSTDAVFASSGVYTLRLTANDGLLSAYDELTVSVLNPVNESPTISDIDDTYGYINAPSTPIEFMVGDAETLSTELTITTSSSDQDLVTDDSIVVSGVSDGIRFLEVRPVAHQIGAVTITVEVSDGEDTAVDTFEYTITDIVDVAAPTIPVDVEASTVSTSAISVSWATSTDLGTNSGDPSGLVGYVVYRGGTAVATTTDTFYSVTDLEAETEYVFTVVSYDENNNYSAHSSEVSATTSSVPSRNRGGSSRSSTTVISTSVTSEQPTSPGAVPVSGVDPVALRLQGLLTGASFGAYGDHIKALQVFLIAQGFLAIGYDTGYFGSLTRDAVIGLARARQETQTSQPTSTLFTRDLDIGASGADVRALQEYLNTHGYVLVSDGPGSVGHETGLFGGLTRAALIRFQIANNISPAVGFFGPVTRAFVERNF